jgi:predicted GNAT superfamily acetyltransferase
MDSQFTIAPLETIEQFNTCEQLQLAIWESQPGEVIPSHMLITFQRHGGLVLGAFDPDGQMIGLSIGFLGLTAGDQPLAGHAAWQHCSHELGVVRAWRDRGVGYQLKLAQREWVLSQGLDLVTWTYDPLEVANGSLNIGKLGALCRCYLRNLYGTMADGLNAGLPSDRFEVAWQIRSERVRQRLRDGWQRPSLAVLLEAGVPIANPAQDSDGGPPRPGTLLRPQGPSVLIEIPANFQALKKLDLGLARGWRAHSREALEACFAAGYSVADVVLSEAGGMRRAFYLLQTLQA